MDELRQWVNWRLWNKPGVKKPVKLPISPITGDAASSTNPAQWATRAEAEARGGNIGFVFTANDPYFLIDIDDAVSDDGSTWQPHALDICDMFPGAYVEVSQSGRGLHIIGRGVAPEGHVNKNADLNIELYTRDRFVAYTGTGAGDCDAVFDLSRVCAKYFAPRDTIAGALPAEWTNAPHERWLGLTDDDALIKKACSSKSVASSFGQRASFKQLWTCDVDALAAAYPDPDRSYDESLADSALAQHLAFWTGNDCERMSRLMHLSGLARDKYERDDYMRSTILLATSRQHEFHRLRPEATPDTVRVTPSARIISGFQYLDATAQIEHFKHCTYVSGIHRVIDPNGEELRPEQFNAVYGGYVFQLDSELNGKTTTKAWEAFTESQVVRYPTAHRVTFEPSRGPFELIERDGFILANTWRPIDVPRVAGDVTRFTDHLVKLFPVVSDREIIIAYMAAVVQFQGHKFKWCPLIQGAEGNGKTLLTKVVAAAVGERYTHLPTAANLDEKYNDWLFNKVFIGIEDIHVPESKAEVWERMKPMITGELLGCRAMQRSEVTRRQCANFILNSNHVDAVRKTESDRRVAPFYTPQQCAADIIRDGMGGDYFTSIYKWLDRGGYSAVSEWLHTYAIPDELNPTIGASRAPLTSSTAAAIELSRGRLEQEILEAISDGRAGFCGGWVSSMALNTLLRELRGDRALPPNKRRAAMQSLGYDYHPALLDGRCNRNVLPDGGKPRLFVKLGSIPSQLTSPSKVADVYEAAQNNLSNKMLDTGR